MALTKTTLKQLFQGYNNVSEQTVNDLADYLFNGNQTTNKISQASSSVGLTIAAIGDKLTFYGGTVTTRQSVSAQAFAAPTDLPTALTQIINLQTVVSDMRTALGNTKLNLFNVV
jgi:hypothetical protein